jgi:hypothetical protein
MIIVIPDEITSFKDELFRTLCSRRLPKTKKKKPKLRGLSPQANSTDRATAACRRCWCQVFMVDGVTWSAQQISTAVNLGFLDRSRYFFI